MLATECSNPHAMRAVVGKTVERIAITDHHVTEDTRARAETAFGSATRQNRSGLVVEVRGIEAPAHGRGDQKGRMPRFLDKPESYCLPSEIFKPDQY